MLQSLQRHRNSTKLRNSCLHFKETNFPEYIQLGWFSISIILQFTSAHVRFQTNRIDIPNKLDRQREAFPSLYLILFVLCTRYVGVSNDRRSHEHILPLRYSIEYGSLISFLVGDLTQIDQFLSWMDPGAWINPVAIPPSYVSIHAKYRLVGGSMSFSTSFHSTTFRALARVEKQTWMVF